MQNDDIEIDWGKELLIPEGDYEAVYVSHETYKGTFGPKIKINFKIMSLGEHFEKEVFAWYNLADLKSKAGKGKSIKLKRHHKLTAELLNILDRKEKVSRLSPSILKGQILLIKIRTVKKNSKQKDLPEILRYSTVDQILGKLTLTSSI